MDETVRAGGQNPQATIPGTGTGTGTGNRLLVRALLPQSSSGRAAVLLYAATPNSRGQRARHNLHDERTAHVMKAVRVPSQ